MFFSSSCVFLIAGSMFFFFFSLCGYDLFFPPSAFSSLPAARKQLTGPYAQSAVETALERTQHSMWKLSREVRAISKKLQQSDGATALAMANAEVDVDHDMYELLEGFVGALQASRGADRAKWTAEGVELGEMLDRVKADMEWWDDGKDEDED